MFIKQADFYQLMNPDATCPESQFTIDQAVEKGISDYRDLDGDGYLDIDPNHELSDNFKYKELIASDNAKTFGLENRVPANRTDIILNAEYTAKNLLEPCRTQFGGFTPNSWYRGPEVEFAATHRDGFSKYMAKTYRRTSNSEPTLDVLTARVQASNLLRTIVADAKSGNKNAGIILHLWNNYFNSKQHPNGEAVDFEIKGSNGNKALWDWIKKSSLKYDQLILEFHNPSAGAFSGWVHGSVVDEARTGKKNRMSAFTI